MGMDELEAAGDEIPSPGSPLAVMRGCRCPVLDNARGAGWCGSGEFWITEGCPLHDPAAAPPPAKEAPAE